VRCRGWTAAAATPPIMGGSPKAAPWPESSPAHRPAATPRAESRSCERGGSAMIWCSRSGNSPACHPDPLHRITVRAAPGKIGCSTSGKSPARHPDPLHRITVQAPWGKIGCSTSGRHAVRIPDPPHPINGGAADARRRWARFTPSRSTGRAPARSERPVRPSRSAGSPPPGGGGGGGGVAPASAFVARAAVPVDGGMLAGMPPFHRR